MRLVLKFNKDTILMLKSNTEENNFIYTHTYIYLAIKPRLKVIACLNYI